MADQTSSPAAPSAALDSRIIDLVVVSLECDQPVSVAAPENAALKSVDLPVAKRPTDGAAYLPATSVVGALRQHASVKLRPDELIGLFGGGGGDRDDEKQFQPSAVRAMGTRIGKNQLQTRAQTAIDRYRAAAAKGALRTRESLSAGTQFEVYLSLVGGSEEHRKHLRDVLADWQPVLGGGRSVGYGRARVTSIHHRQLDLARTKHLAEWLALGGPGTWQTDKWEPWQCSDRSAKPGAEFVFTLVDDLRVAGHDKRDQSAPDQLPGSSIKGIFRSRAEFVLRTLGLRACASTTADSVAAAAQGMDPACRTNPCLICQLFGFAGGGADQPGQRGALWFRDAALTDVKTAVRTHVAIDRFSGGQAHGLLFNTQVVAEGKATVAVDIDLADEGRRAVAMALLNIVAVDIHDGFVGFGGGTARGMGSARLTEERANEARRRWASSLELVRAAAGEAAR